jgi:hypothetical protein
VKAGKLVLRCICEKSRKKGKPVAIYNNTTIIGDNAMQKKSHDSASFEERKFYAERPRFSKPLAGHSVMMPQLLRSGVFAPTSGAVRASYSVPNFDDISANGRGASVEYRGASLRQYDLRVLLSLVQRAGGMDVTDAIIEFDANDFLAGIGKSTGTRSIDVLRESLINLRSATFVVRDYARDKGSVFGFVNSVEWVKRRCVVRLSPAAHWNLELLGHTYVPMAVRSRLVDGVQTALADLLFASTAASIDLDALAALWGREAVELGREVRAALVKLEAVGIVQEWRSTRGRVHVVRGVIR